MAAMKTTYKVTAPLVVLRKPEVANREEAEYWARRCPLGPGTSLEVRRINDLADFASEVEEGDRLRRERQQEWQSANG